MVDHKRVGEKYRVLMKERIKKKRGYQTIMVE